MTLLGVIKGDDTDGVNKCVFVADKRATTGTTVALRNVRKIIENDGYVASFCGDLTAGTVAAQLIEFLQERKVKHNDLLSIRSIMRDAKVIFKRSTEIEESLSPEGVILIGVKNTKHVYYIAMTGQDFEIADISDEVSVWEGSGAIMAQVITEYSLDDNDSLEYETLRILNLQGLYRAVARVEGSVGEQIMTVEYSTEPKVKIKEKKSDSES